jgi:hypothetical protein
MKKEKKKYAFGRYICHLTLCVKYNGSLKNKDSKDNYVEQKWDPGS